MKVVQDEEINPAVNTGIGRDVGFDRRRRRRGGKARRRLDGQRNERECGDLLRPSILQYFEIGLPEVGDQSTLLVCY